MAGKVTMWIVPDQADRDRTYARAGVAAGDMILEMDNNTLYVVHPTALQPVGAAPTSTTTASTTQSGSVKKMAHIANLVAAPTQSDFNNLLAALQAAGIMA